MTIYIVEIEQGASRPRKSYLESRAHDVEIVQFEHIDTFSKMTDQDIIFLDIHQSNPISFLSLSSFIKTPPAPKILVATFEGDVFFKDDEFAGLDVDFIFKPFRPADLAASIDRLQRE